MKKVAIILVPGFEEGEALTLADIIKRANIHCDLIGIRKIVEGGHKIKVKCDDIISYKLIDYDMVILPGGYGGVDNMCKCQQLLELLKKRNENGKYIGAMCAGPFVLSKINLLENKNYTAYQGYEKKIHQGYYLEDIVVEDHHIITGRGPATVYAFAYKIIELLDGDSDKIKKQMLYSKAFNEKEGK